MRGRRSGPKTVAGRLRARVETGRPSKAGTAAGEPDYEMVERVLLETTEGITVLGRLLTIAEKAGVFEFDLASVLNNYLNDVQVVAEFKAYREKILGVFEDVMWRVHAQDPTAEIYIVGHSEGSVVAFLSLLNAIVGEGKARARAGREHSAGETHEKDETCTWITQVRGLMTIGSPIDKHLVLWPELFRDIERPTWQPGSGIPQIKWRNYYDYGDPIGFKLDTAREWLDANGWDAFEFDAENHDIGFGRYPFPGEAHNRYWNDEGVFGHVLQDVMQLSPPEKHPKPPPRARPGNRITAQVMSYVLPYALFATILCAMVYLMTKAIDTLTGSVDVSGGDLLRDSVGIASLFAGVTIVARLPRLTRDGMWRLASLGAFAGLTILYALLTHDARQAELGTLATLLFGAGDLAARQFVLGLAAVVALVALVAGILRPRWGVKTLLYLGCLVVLSIVGCQISLSTGNKADSGPIWPVVLAGSSFLYLWWLACILFDLTFVWHRYIRHEAGRAIVEPHVKKAITYETQQVAPPPPAQVVATGLR